MAESIEERKARLERVTGQAKAKQKAAASRRMERALKKEKHRENLKGNTRPISKKKLIAGLEEVWQEKMQDRYPDLKLPKWSAKERGQALHLIEQFDTSLAALLVRYSVETWSGISTRFFKRDSVPSIGSVLRFSGSLVIEAQTWKIYADAEAAYQATRKDPSDPYDYGDDELYQKSERARRACVEAGIFDK